MIPTLLKYLGACSGGLHHTGNLHEPHHRTSAYSLFPYPYQVRSGAGSEPGSLCS